MSHWQQLNHDQYRLIHNGEVKDFDGFDSLFRFCRKHGIDPAATAERRLTALQSNQIA